MPRLVHSCGPQPPSRSSRSSNGYVSVFPGHNTSTGLGTKRLPGHFCLGTRITPLTVRAATTLSVAPAVVGSNTLAIMVGYGCACWLLYVRTGVRSWFIVRVD